MPDKHSGTTCVRTHQLHTGEGEGGHAGIIIKLSIGKLLHVCQATLKLSDQLRTMSGDTSWFQVVLISNCVFLGLRAFINRMILVPLPWWWLLWELSHAHTHSCDCSCCITPGSNQNVLITWMMSSFITSPHDTCEYHHWITSQPHTGND